MVPLSRPYKVSEIADILGCQMVGDPDFKVQSVGSTDDICPGMLCYAYTPIKSSQCVVIASSEYKDVKATLVVDDPRDGMRLLLSKLFPNDAVEPSIHPSAIIAPDVQIPQNVTIGPYAVISSGVRLSEGVVIGPHAVIKSNVTIGKGSHIAAHAFIDRSVVIGTDTKIGVHAVIGDVGFGYDKTDDGWQPIPQVASVVIGDNVDIGPNTSIDRGTLVHTKISDGVTIDCNCWIGHGSQIGAHTLMVAMSGISGSVKVGSYCVMGGGCKIADNLQIADKVMLAGCTSVYQSIHVAGAYASVGPLLPIKKWRRYFAQTKKAYSE